VLVLVLVLVHELCSGCRYERLAFYNPYHGQRK
jgi:hypothetical protein